MQLENSMLMYGVYNAEMLEMLTSTVHHIHNTTSSHESYLKDNRAHQHSDHFMQMH